MKNSQLLLKNPIYSAIEFTMREYQLAYLGGTAFKRNVRQKRPNEDEKLYNDVISNTVSLPISRYVVDTINDTVFTQQVYRELCFTTAQGVELSDDATEWTDLIMYDADLTNRSLDAVMENIGDLTSIFGHCWVFVDMPSVEQGSMGRPYVVAVSPLDVWDWSYTTVNGRQIPGYIKIKEYEDDLKWRFKCYYLGTTTSPSRWETWECDRGSVINSEATLIDSGNFPPGMAIPGFVAYTRRDPRTLQIGVSDIDAASDAQREIYKLECEAYQSIQFARTLIRADAGVKIPAHAGGIVRATEGQVETLVVDTQDVNNIITKQQDILTSLENTCGFGGLRNNREQVQSGISLIEERRQLHRVAKAKARQLEIAEEMIWTFMARYMDCRWAGEITYGTDYEQGDTKYQIALMNTAKALSGDNAVIREVIDNKVLELLVDSDEIEIMRERMMVANGQEREEERGPEIEVETRDIGDQVPRSLDQSTVDAQTGNRPLETVAPGIQYTGQSSYNPAADMLMNQSTGR
jgi:hypothetical protein